MTSCKICGSVPQPIFAANVLGKHEVYYHRCTLCGFIQTDEPFWLAEAYSDAINEIDLGCVNRAVTAADIGEGVILSHLDERGRFVDFGGGYGIFVRLMRDRGYDFSWFDAHCENLFAKHFVRDPAISYDLVTAFEVFEHFADPVSEIEAMLKMGRNIFFSTVLLPHDENITADWWYFAPEHGQHISFYTPKALSFLARKFNLHLASDGHSYHLLSERPMSEARFRMFARRGHKAAIYRKYVRQRRHIRSLLDSDFQTVSGRHMKN